MTSSQARQRPPSIKDVAALARVSVPTVSRYLNDRWKVSEEKCQQIAKAIDMLGYRPSPIARALVRERTSFVTVLCANTTLFGQSETLHGIEEQAQESGYSLNIAMLAGSSRSEVRTSVQSALDHNPAGVILLNYDELSSHAFSVLPDGLPVVMIAGQRTEDVAQISMCENVGGYDVTRHLLDLGHRSVVHISIPGGVGGYSRLTGWKRALQEAGIYQPEPIMASWDPASGREIGRRLAEDPHVTAIFAGNDEIAMGVIRGLSDMGRRVPQDVSVVGFDDHPIARVWNPALTTLRQDFRQAGRRAFTMLTDKIDDIDAGRGRTENWTKYVEIPGELIVRESTACPPAGRDR
ncbi:LacI family DNA-binding transcriptional regulator [Trueperella sp. LYQ143]|uniref:LacI family DNA-binding transcriptional regulator n=1 Tax=unclassified Trueperella TaxID=2630174 RepID=UPI003982F27C